MLGSYVAVEIPPVIALKSCDYAEYSNDRFMVRHNRKFTSRNETKV